MKEIRVEGSIKLSFSTGWLEKALLSRDSMEVRELDMQYHLGKKSFGAGETTSAKTSVKKLQII